MQENLITGATVTCAEARRAQALCASQQALPHHFVNDEGRHLRGDSCRGCRSVHSEALAHRVVEALARALRWAHTAVYFSAL